MILMRELLRLSDHLGCISQLQIEAEIGLGALVKVPLDLADTRRAIGLTLPNFVELRITKSEPWAKGDTASGSTKPATLETGHVVQVPPFVNEGELVRVDTRTGLYVERVKG